MSHQDATLVNAEAVVRLLEASASVVRRHQFFGWVQGNFKGLLPHAVLSCGSYNRGRRQLGFDVFNNVVLDPWLLEQLHDPGSELLSGAINAWVNRGSQAVALATRDLIAGAEESRLLEASRLTHLLVHGVSRPQRPRELESFFLLCEPGYAVGPSDCAHLQMLLPSLHSTYLRMQSSELELGVKARPAKPVSSASREPALTGREQQILQGVREGMSNQQVGQTLGISALTVKNHVQNILRKLGAANRAQAVSKAIALGALPIQGSRQADDGP